ncbi:hypothetical protein A2U01_0101677 [Trifolium medium]|uniref:Uncharacterized protein n=1 Tax=Trifolium medium TaxID=97028 RepID=A0A392UWL1_9FABA|nr:hypothetical protein [Trifolium medium]
MASKASLSAPVVNPLNPLDLPPIATLGKIADYHWGCNEVQFMSTQASS